MKLAGIDIGSNAMRLLVSNVYETGEWAPVVRKANLYRAPVRLGADAFLQGRISEKREEQFVKAMWAFRHLMDVCAPEAYLACATSALRNAENGQEIVERVFSETGIAINIIDGAKEAAFIALNRLDKRFMKGAFLYIDVGGGSTELTFQKEGVQLGARSFEVGTVRLKEGIVEQAVWDDMRRWVKRHAGKAKDVEAIGSGGNINKIFKLAGRPQEIPLSFKKLKNLHAILTAMTLEQRMVRVGLRPDRADVIGPAGSIFLKVMKWGGMKKIHVPQIGLADGIIHHLYREKMLAKSGEVPEV